MNKCNFLLVDKFKEDLEYLDKLCGETLKVANDNCSKIIRLRGTVEG